MTEHVRLLICHICKSLEELPDFEGRPEDDHLLAVLAARHQHRENPEAAEKAGVLLKVEKRHWDSPSTREAIEARIRESSGYTGLDPRFYAAKETFKWDAFACWRAHRRDPDCNDYKSDSKILVPDTAAERKEAGLPKYHSRHTRYLCEFCPVHSLVTTAARKRAGLYDN
jgi:hypothetical protein